jgi:hypothetical protein
VLEGVINCATSHVVSKYVATSETPFIERRNIILCWDGGGRRHTDPCSKRLYCVYFPGFGPCTLRLVQPWSDTHLAVNEHNSYGRMFCILGLAKSVQFYSDLSLCTLLEPMSLSTLSENKSMTSVFEPKDPAFVFPSLKITNDSDWP